MEWALRSYGTEPQIWDGDPDCRHDWTINAEIKSRGGIHGDWERNSRNERISKPQESNFCNKCDAWKGDLGLEPYIDQYISHLCDVFDEVWRVLADYGTLWVNIGDTFYGSGAGHKSGGKNDAPVRAGVYAGANGHRPTQGKEPPAKCLTGIPERFVIEMINRGWIRRNTIVWHKPSAIPESVRDRFTIDFEYIYLFTKKPKYYFKQQFEPIKQSSIDRYKFENESTGMEGPIVGGKKYTDRPSEIIGGERFSGEPIRARLNRNKRCVWTIGTAYVKDAHFACVDEDTECLTMNGWKTYDEIQIGEVVASFNMNTGLLEWDIVKDLHIYEYENKILSIGNLILGHRITPNHRCIVRNYRRKSETWSDYYIKRADELTSYDRIPVSSEWINGSFGIGHFEPENKDLCELLGWIASYGHYSQNTVSISQSYSANREKCDRIEYLLDKCDIIYKKYTRTITNRWNGSECIMNKYSIGRKHSDTIRSILPYKKLTTDIILWSKEGLKRFLSGFIGGDGHIRKEDERISIVQKDETTIDILQAIAFRLGYSVIKSHRKAYEKNPSTYVIYLTKRKYASIRKTNGKGINLEQIDYKGKVWCPETNNTTFVARRNGRIMITGNTFSSKLIEGPIDAGCPKQVCKKCGLPRMPVFKTIAHSHHDRIGKAIKPVGGDYLISGAGHKEGGFATGKHSTLKEHRLVGWTDCECEEPEYRSGIVLDPFIGSGTTGMVAKEQGLYYVGIDLKEEYVEMANKRIDTAQTRLDDF